MRVKLQLKNFLVNEADCKYTAIREFSFCVIMLGTPMQDPIRKCLRANMGEKKASIKKNLGYQTLYQIVISTLPLITAPYLARVLGLSLIHI